MKRLNPNSLVTLLHQAVPANASKDDMDVLVQVEAITASLRRLGYRVQSIPVDLNFNQLEKALAGIKPDMVFNLVESIAGTGKLIYFAPAVLEFLKIPFTGSGSDAMYRTSGKVGAKEIMQQHAIPTPPWYTTGPHSGSRNRLEAPVIIKPVWEEASVGLDDTAVIRENSLIADALALRSRRFGECFVESYISGREFNISVLGTADGPRVLPPAEMVFHNYPDTIPRIVGYAAKWDEQSFEYNNTVRKFRFNANEQPLLNRLHEISLQCWHAFHLSGYVRVDFRIDEGGNPFVLEINANPCISPDSGFVAAATEAGLTYDGIIQHILDDAVYPAEGRG